MKKFVKFYLIALPFISLLGIILSTLRIAFQTSYISYILIGGAVLDAFVVFLGRKHLNNPKIFFLVVLLTISILIGLLSGNELSRRYITDFTNPFFFFSKVLIFSAYWKECDFSKFLNYYVKVAFWGSLGLLPLVYFLFRSSGVNRISIFPPLELPFAVYMQSGGVLTIISLLMILLYGKRAQLGAAVMTFIIFIFIFKRSQFIKYTILSIAMVLIGSLFISEFTDNPAVARISNTVTTLFNSDDKAESLSSVSAGRDDEIDSVLKIMDDLDYFTGLGIGFTYDLDNFSNEGVSNLHFSPLSFLSKYGLIFTIFLYLFFIKQFLSVKKEFLEKDYIAAYATVVFVFLESFFAYAIFVTPILPVAMGYIYHYQKKELK